MRKWISKKRQNDFKFTDLVRYKTNRKSYMTIQVITTRKAGQTFDGKSIQIEPKALAVPIVAQEIMQM